jgi:hypothetical protein
MLQPAGFAALTHGHCRRPRPNVCSGRILLLAVSGRSGTTTDTLRTSQPSRSISTLTMAVVLIEEPVLQQPSRRLRTTGVPCGAPGVDVLTYAVDEWSRARRPSSGDSVGFRATHGTFTCTSLVVSLPKMSTTLTCIRRMPGSS